MKNGATDDGGAWDIEALPNCDFVCRRTPNEETYELANAETYRTSIELTRPSLALPNLLWQQHSHFFFLFNGRVSLLCGCYQQGKSTAHLKLKGLRESEHVIDNPQSFFSLR